jgi:hypothetical protein
MATLVVHPDLTPNTTMPREDIIVRISQQGDGPCSGPEEIGAVRPSNLKA